VGVAALAGLLLVGCGQTPQQAAENAADDGNPPDVGTVDEGVTGEELVLASPGAGNPTNPTPELRAIDTEGTEVALKDGKLDPERIEANVGDPFVITVTGDGTAHTFEIEGVVAETEIAADGQTNVEFTAPEESADYPITIDGKQAGIFAAQGAGGIIDED
jgi:hypothetical protein